jgi:hypothetical protein
LPKHINQKFPLWAFCPTNRIYLTIAERNCQSGLQCQVLSQATERTVLFLESHPREQLSRVELFPRVGFIVTNTETDSRALVRFYNKRGTAEQWIKEGKQAMKMTRLSCHRFRPNEVRVWLSVIAYNLGRRVAAARAAQEDRQLVLDQLAAEAGKDRRSAGETCPLLLAAFGREPSNPATLWSNGAKDGGSHDPNWIELPVVARHPRNRSH